MATYTSGNAGNATLSITPVVYVEKSAQPLQAILLTTFALWGIYSVLFCTYIYFQVYFFQRSRKRRFIYPVSLIALYILITAHTIFSTLSFNRALTSETMIELTYNPSFLSSVAGTHSSPDSRFFDFLRFNMAGEVSYMIASFIADGILICRCYYLWAARKSVIAAPIFFYILNLGFFLAALVTEATSEDNFDPPFLLASPTGYGIALKLALVFALVTIITNMLLTGLIAGRIFWLTKAAKSEHNSGAYSRLLAIILESGLLYAFTLIIGVCLLSVMSLVEFLPISAQAMASVSHSVYITSTPHLFLVATLQGIAPTLILVRVDLRASVESVSTKEEFTDKV
ncbi:hypothetical protein D9757_010551 [Collybiopsis confluens]|uniref:Uncharacterized protein n=1 Tax=Collybiopsis confluens TaxID=2823264 RepID=A0A8H5GYA1_9AGAR|nr:hypothetical protein D9757_010551 [Collybiopsis confluens]